MYVFAGETDGVTGCKECSGIGMEQWHRTVEQHELVHKHIFRHPPKPIHAHHLPLSMETNPFIPNHNNLPIPQPYLNQTPAHKPNPNPQHPFTLPHHPQPHLPHPFTPHPLHPLQLDHFPLIVSLYCRLLYSINVHYQA